MTNESGWLYVLLTSMYNDDTYICHCRWWYILRVCRSWFVDWLHQWCPWHQGFGLKVCSCRSTQQLIRIQSVHRNYGINKFIVHCTVVVYSWYMSYQYCVTYSGYFVVYIWYMSYQYCVTSSGYFVVYISCMSYQYCVTCNVSHAMVIFYLYIWYTSYQYCIICNGYSVAQSSEWIHVDMIGDKQTKKQFHILSLAVIFAKMQSPDLFCRILNVIIDVHNFIDGRPQFVYRCIFYIIYNWACTVTNP